MGNDKHRAIRHFHLKRHERLSVNQLDNSYFNLLKRHRNSLMLLLGPGKMTSRREQIVQDHDGQPGDTAEAAVIGY